MCLGPCAVTSMLAVVAASWPSVLGSLLAANTVPLVFGSRVVVVVLSQVSTYRSTGFALSRRKGEKMPGSTTKVALL